MLRRGPTMDLLYHANRAEEDLPGPILPEEDTRIPVEETPTEAAAESAATSEGRS